MESEPPKTRLLPMARLRVTPVRVEAVPAITREPEPSGPAEAEALPVGEVLVGGLACLKAGRRSLGSTSLEPPAQAKLSAEDLRRWSRVLQAGMVAEELIYGEAKGGDDDRALLGRLWGLSGYDAATAQREQRQARREVLQRLRQQRTLLEQQAEQLLAAAPRLGRTSA